MKRKFVFLIFILMLGLFIIPNFKPKAAAYTGGYTVNLIIDSDDKCMTRYYVYFKNGDARIYELDDEYIAGKTMNEVGYYSTTINNVTSIYIDGADSSSADISIDGEVFDFSGNCFEYELTSDINFYYNDISSSGHSAIINKAMSYNVNVIIDNISEFFPLDAFVLYDTTHNVILSLYYFKELESLTFSNVFSINFDAADYCEPVLIKFYDDEIDIGGYSNEYLLNSDVNVYFNKDGYAAVVESISIGYSLTYIIGTQEETVSSLTAVPTLPTPTKEGYIFDGWYYESTFETKVNEGDSLSSDTRIYAKFNQLYDINFVVKYNGVELRQIDPIINVTEIPGNLPNPDEDDYLTFYEFKGWYLDEAFTSGITEGIQLGRDITLYAKLEIISYTLSFVTNTDLITLDPVQITGESMMTIGSLPVLSNHRFDFLGWYYEEDFITQVQETDCLIEDTIIYAKLINKYLLNYETGLEEFDSYYIDSIYTDKIVIPTWTYDNFVCDAWFYDMERTIEVSADDLLTQDTTIYALISQKSYQIIFDTDGANNIDPIVSTNIFSEENQPIPHKEHYIFIGWFYDNESFHEPVIFNDILIHDTVLYAKFDHVKYNITFDSNGGTSINSVQQSFFNLDNIIPSKIGYEFLGWYKDVDCINKINEFDEVTEDTTVYANWRLKVINNVQDSTNDFDINDFINDYGLYIIIIFGLLFIFKRRR